MNQPDTQGSIYLVRNPVVKAYDNGSAVLILPDLPHWIRTSSVGIWIIDLLRKAPHTSEEIIAKVRSNYDLPDSAVRPSTLQFLDTLIGNGYAENRISQNISMPQRDEVQSDIGDSKEQFDIVPQRLEDLDLQELWLHITTRCNLQCNYCYYLDQEPVSELHIETAQRLINEAAALGVRNIVISGGEPMLHSRILDLVKIFREGSDWTIKIVSNGTMPQDNTAIFDDIVELIDDLQISLDGIDSNTHDAIRGPGSFERIKCTFKHLYDTKSSVQRGISFTPLPENIDQIPELNKIAYDLSANYIHLNQPKQPRAQDRLSTLKRNGFFSQEFMHEAIMNFRHLTMNILDVRKHSRGLARHKLTLDGSFSYAASLVHILHRNNCGAGMTQLAFDTDGSVYPCASLTGRDSCYLGSFPNSSLAELNAAGRKWNQSIFSVDRDPICSQCVFRHFCGGGCRASAEIPSQRDIFCSVIKECYNDFFKYISLPDEIASKETNETEDAQG